MNPLRYRGYYYDSDTNLYYLQSRYYDANIGRFINSDDAGMSIFGIYNLFNYCHNNPIMFADKSGKWAEEVVGRVLYVGFRFVTNYRLSFMLYGLSASIAKTTQYVFYLNKVCMPIVNVMTDRFKNSKKVQKRIKNYIKKAGKGTYTKCQYIDFYNSSGVADKDLQYAIGDVSSFTMQVKYISENKKTKKYEVSIAVVDKYDFRLLSKDEKTKMIRLINNYGGYFPMKLGFIDVYYWSAYCKFYYTINK